VLKRTLPVLALGAVAATGSIFLTQSASAGTIARPAPAIGLVRGVATDSRHQHVFVGDSYGQITVTDFTGQVVTQLAAYGPLGGLAVSADESRVYAAVPSSDEIVAIDTSTLTQVAAYPLGDGIAPAQVSQSGNTLWFGYAGDSTGLGSVDLLGTDHTVTTWPQPETQDSSAAPLVAVSPTDPDLLATAVPGAPSVVRLFDVSTGAPVQKASHTTPGRVTDLAFSPDGGRLLDDGGNQAAEELRTTDLSMIEEYPAGVLAHGVAVAGDGTVAVGTSFDGNESSTGPDVRLYKPGSTTPTKTLTLDKLRNPFNGDTVSYLTFEPGSDRVIVLAHAIDDTTSFQLLNDERAKAATTISIKTSSPSIGRNEPFMISGVVTERTNGVTKPAAGARVEIDQTGPDGDTFIWNFETTGPDGTYQSGDLIDGFGKYLFTAKVMEDLTRFPASASTAVDTRHPTTLTIDHNNATYGYGATVLFTARLGTTAFSRTVALWADPAGTDQANRLVGSAEADVKGNVTGTLKLTRNTTVTAIFAGDAQTQPLTVKSTVLVHASVSSALSGQYKTKNSVAYFHQKKNPSITTTMNAFPKRKQYLTVEYYSGGKWHLVKSGYYTLTSAGKSSVTFSSARKLDVKYRVRAAYVAGKSGDSGNVTTYGAYRYFSFTK
jgi:hypothetical protein